MCGIFGYIGAKNGITASIEGLKRLEYRGYDSAGVAALSNGALIYRKAVGKVEVLASEVTGLTGDTVIAHTRWATHGVPNKENAHPHLDKDETLAIVHNGIIENSEPLKRALQQRGYTFSSTTDSEVVAKLLGSLYTGDLLLAVQETIALLHGAFAIALIHKDYPGQIMAFCKDMPLVIGVGDSEMFLSSDATAFAAHTRKVIYMNDGEIAVLKRDRLEVFNASLDRVSKEVELLAGTAFDVSKGDFAHFTLKEIFEQPEAFRNAIASRFIEDYGTAVFDERGFDLHSLSNSERVLILGCGSSLHAAYIAAYMIEEMARIPVQVEISSEFRYKNPIVEKGTLVIAISQSGETADTLAAVKELKAKGAFVLALCNTQGSTLARTADTTLYLHAGPEVAVASTKAFINQLAVLSLFTLFLARRKHLDKAEGKVFLQALLQLPDSIGKVLAATPTIEAVAKKYAGYDNFFFLGRSYLYPAALEGALKLKEISYINANGYPAGEMKHGPIALINADCPTVALAANRRTYDKLLSNLMEVKARGGKIIVIAEASAKGLEAVADDIIRIPDCIDELAAVPSVVATQLLAYYIAKERGSEIDQPRNLAKSVTVE